jgi:hypothetical protein
MPGNLKAFTNDLAREGTLFVGAQLILHQGLARASLDILNEISTVFICQLGLAFTKAQENSSRSRIGSLWVNKKGRLNVPRIRGGMSPDVCVDDEECVWRPGVAPNQLHDDGCRTEPVSNNNTCLRSAPAPDLHFVLKKL